MAAYLIVDVHITDPTRYEEYKKLAAPTISAYGGRYIARGGATERLEGERTPGRVVIVEFPTSERAREWWSSREYSEAKAMRQAASTTEMWIVEGM